MRQAERIASCDGPSEHIVQLFDTPESLADTVSTYLAEGYRQGHTLVVVATPAHWNLILACLLSDCPIDAAIAEGRLLVLDANATLQRIMRSGMPAAGRFDRVIGGLVRGLRRRHEGTIRIYGEMVDILAGDGDFEGAQRLEELWNGLAASESFTLLCGYLSARYADPLHNAALHRICQSHTRQWSHAHDRLGSWLLDRQDDHHVASAPVILPID